MRRALLQQARDFGALGHLRAELLAEINIDNSWDRQCAAAMYLTVVMRVLVARAPTANDNGRRQ